MLFIVRTKIFFPKTHILQDGHIGRQDFRIIGHHRAVVMIVTDFFVKIVRHAGIEYFIDALFLYEMGHAAMHHFGGIAYCIGRNCRLPFQK